MYDPSELRGIAGSQRKATKSLLGRLAKRKEDKVDNLFHVAHEEVFARTNCLNCANCCKTTGPLFLRRDVERLARHFRMRPADFVHRYLRIDEDGDYVLKSVPCAFLNDDNTCSVYDIRPKACREYPHTDRHRQQQIFNLTAKNAEICPAVFEILQEIKKKLNG